MTLGERIRQHRQRAKLTQEKLAELVGVSRQAVAKWESGQSAPSTENLFKLAQIFDTTVDLLLPGEQTDSKADEPLAQALQLYRMMEQQRRARRNQNLKHTAALALGWLGLFLLCRVLYTPFEDMSVMGWLLTTSPHHNAYLFGWLLSGNLFFISSTISILPAFWGKWRFSAVTLFGCGLGILLGELLGPYPAGIPYGHRHYGWAIWGGMFLASVVIGILLEVLNKRRNT